jgi:DNA-binding MarR family transcriptional regulator
MVENGFAHRSSCRAGISCHTLLVQVLHFPAKGMGAIGAQMFELNHKIALARIEIFSLVHVHLFRMQGQHDGGFNLSPVNILRLVLRRNKTVGQAKARPAGGNGQHIEPDTGLGGDNRQQWGVTAMGVQQQAFGDALHRQLLQNTQPAGNCGLIGQALASGIIQMFDRIADRFGLEPQDIHIGIGFVFQAGNYAFHDQPVGFEGQMRAMLFECAQGKDCYRHGVAPFLFEKLPCSVIQCTTLHARDAFMAKKDKSEKKGKKQKSSESQDARPELAGELIQAARSFRTALSNSLSECGLYAGQDGVILILNATDGLTAGQIAQKLQVKPPTMTRTIARMEAQGFVERRDDSGDGRLTKVFITELGRGTVALIEAAAIAAQNKATDGFSDKQLRSLVKLVRAVNANFQGVAVDAVDD